MRLVRVECSAVSMLAGGWLCLKNVHLVVTWLPVLDKALRSLDPSPSFRLILTSEPHHAFPASLLEACLKVTIGHHEMLCNADSTWHSSC